ncbi:MAG: DegT/DnrJ/EryC1/StrS family aminotransferase [Nitrospira sp.]
MQLSIIRPTLPSMHEIMQLIGPSWDSGMVTLGPTVKLLEEEVCLRTGAKYSVALSNCTAGLMMVPGALGLPPGKEVIVPSFTFAATAQALLWNGMIPVFCDCLPGTCTIDPEDIERNLSPQTVAICGVSIFGLPPDNEALIDLGRRKGLPVYFDSAQGLGATYNGWPLGGFGVCEVFSMSPTKVVTAVEGGVLTTNDRALAEKIRALRDYGKDPVKGEEMYTLGLSARMSELHAAVGLLSLRMVDELVNARRELISIYRGRLSCLPGCWVQKFPVDRTTSGNYFVLFITDRAKLCRDEVYEALKAAGIQTKRYFYPPVHEHALFQRSPKRISSKLPHTIKISREGLALPLYSHTTLEEINHVCSLIEQLLG